MYWTWFNKSLTDEIAEYNAKACMLTNTLKLQHIRLCYYKEDEIAKFRMVFNLWSIYWNWVKSLKPSYLIKTFRDGVYLSLSKSTFHGNALTTLILLCYYQSVPTPHQDSHDSPLEETHSTLTNKSSWI